MRAIRLAVPGLLAGSLLLGSTSGVFAAKSRAGAHRAVLIGQISNLGASSFTLTAVRGKVGTTQTTRSITVTIAPTTKQRGLAGATALANGDYVLVVGTRAKRAVTANRVVFSTTAFTRAQIRKLRGLQVRGTVVSSAPGTLTISVGKKGKTVSFNLTDTTKFRVNKQVSTTAPTFAAGEKVVIRFTVQKSAAGTRTFTATAVGVPAKQS